MGSIVKPVNTSPVFDASNYYDTELSVSIRTFTQNLINDLCAVKQKLKRRLLLSDINEALGSKLVSTKLQGKALKGARYLTKVFKEAPIFEKMFANNILRVFNVDIEILFTNPNYFKEGAQWVANMIYMNSRATKVYEKHIMAVIKDGSLTGNNGKAKIDMQKGKTARKIGRFRKKVKGGLKSKPPAVEVKFPGPAKAFGISSKVSAKGIKTGRITIRPAELPRIPKVIR
ncbi:MAG: hypothetical protein ABIH00_04245 [Armatimonadota bacterium]